MLFFSVVRGVIRISIHAPREGSDAVDVGGKGKRALFLSTLPARGATAGASDFAEKFAISIHAPREGSDLLAVSCSALWGISIHAPREGSDDTDSMCKMAVYISIHAPREGSDGPQVQHGVADGDISIHAPREGSDHSRPSDYSAHHS